MPNMEFVIDKNGKLLASWEWADPDALKQFLEEKIGPSGISDEEWKALSVRQRRMTDLKDNDEVPGTQVPFSALSDLGVKLLPAAAGNNPPFKLEAGTLPPEITAAGQSRLYLTLHPDTANSFYFDSDSAPEILFSDTQGVELQKTRILAGKRRRIKDIYPHTLGVMWERKESAGSMSFTAEVTAKILQDDSPAQDWKVKYLISGPIPKTIHAVDEILPDKLPPMENLRFLKSTPRGDELIPFNINVYLASDQQPGDNQLGYLVFKLKDGYKWNNLATETKANIKALTGIKLEKTELFSGRHPGEGDRDDRILVFKWAAAGVSAPIAMEIKTITWICHIEEGWCRRFAGTFRISGQ